MDDAPLTHDVPFPMPMRVVLCAVGAFLLYIVPHDLWREVWPWNGLSPVFGAMVLAGVSGGVMAVYTALFAPALTLTFRPGVLEVGTVTPWGRRRQRVPVSSIAGIGVEHVTDSDGPDTWRVTISPSAGPRLSSRSFTSQQEAEDLARALRAKLGM